MLHSPQLLTHERLTRRFLCSLRSLRSPKLDLSSSIKLITRFGVALLVASLLIPLGALEFSGSVNSEASAEVPKRVVQNRREVSTYEWTIGAGTLPLDAFKKGITAGGALTIHRDHLWAWEAISAAYSFEYKTQLEDKLQAYKLRATPFERVETFVSSNVVFKPLYWKGAWLNERMAYGELLFVAGGGYGWLSQTSRPMVNGGLGVKLLHENGLASRLDVRFMSFFNAESFHNELWVNLGISL